MDSLSLQILLVEDNPTDVLLLEEALEEARASEFTLTTVKRLDEALALLHDKRFDVVLVDLGLPDSQGLETFVSMHSRYPGIPVLVLSGLDDETIALLAVQQGAQDYLVKGVIASRMLVRTIRYAIERTRSDQRVVASEASYRRLFETAQDGIFILDAITGQITDANPYLETLLDYKITEFLGKRLWEIAPFRDKAASQAAFRTLQEKAHFRYEALPLIARDGKQVVVEFTSNIYEVDSLQVIQCNIRDITARKRAEEERDRFFTLSLDMLCIAGRDGYFKRVNPAWQKTLGYSEAELLATPILEFVHPEDRASTLGSRALLHQGEVTPDFENRYRCRDGSYRWLRWNMVADRETELVYGVAHDITERKKATDAFAALSEKTERRERLLSTALSSMSDFAQIYDREGRLMYANQPLLNLWGLTLEEVVGKNFFDLGYPDELAERLQRQLQEVFETAQRIIDETPYKNPAGQEGYYEYIFSPVFESDGRIDFVVGSTRDITERKRGLQRLTEAQRIGQIGDWERDFATQAITWSPQVFAIVGRDPSLGPPRNYEEHAAIYDAASQALMTEKVTLAIESGETQDFELLLWRPNGERVDVHARAVPKKDENGRVLGLSGTIQDISVRKRAEAALKNSELRYHSLFENMLEGYAYCRTLSEQGRPRDFVYLEVNTAFERLTGLKDVVGKKVSDLLPGILESNWELLETYSRVASTGKPEKCEEYVELLGIWLSIAVYSPCREHFVVVFDDITVRKQAEERLRDSEQEFRTLSEAMPQIVWMTRPDGWNIYFNQRWMDYTGLTLEESLGHGWNGPFHPDEQQRAWDAWQRATATRGTYSLETRLRGADGSYRWFLVRGAPLQDPEGNIVKWLGTCTDIHDLRLAEEERDRFFTLSLDMLAIIGSDGFMKRLNPAFEATLGFSNAELMAKPFLEFVHPDDIAGTLAEMAKLHRGIQVMRFENRYRCRDGSYKWLKWMAAPFEDLWYCVAHDITDIKEPASALQRANDELEARVIERTGELSLANADLHTEIAERQRAELEALSSRQDLQSFIDAMSTLAAKVAPDGTFLIVNKIAFDASGLSVEEYMKSNFLDGPWWTFDTAVHMRVHEMFRQALTGTTIKYDEDIFVFGQKRTINFSLIPVRGAGGRVEHLIAEGRDITELKQTEVALQQAKEEADRANLAKSEFLSRMSHELRTPLNAILGFGQILDKQALTELQQECVGYMVKGGRHLLDLINEVLDIARVESGHCDLSIEPVSLTDVINDSCALVSPLAAQRGIELLIDQSEPHQTYVLADYQRLKQVFLNLLSNAVKYNRSGGRVSFSCEQQTSGRVRIGVCDTGPGIAAHDLPKLFVPFERLDAGSIEGTGLGLVLSKRLVEAMQGTLTAESTPGQGSTFYIELPGAERLPEPACAHVANSTQESGSAPLPLRTVLYIEDNLSNLRLLEVLLAGRPEITLLAAMQGSLGLELARQQKPDIILLDLDLPDISGREVLARLQQSALTSDIPVIIVSADATPLQIERLLAAGAKSYLTKPLDITEFMKTLDQNL